MPKLPPKQCTYAGCKLYTTKNSRCEEHQRESWATSNNSTPSERGYGYSWTKIRKQALIRDGYLCVVCSNKGLLTKATEVDHILNKAQGGDDDIDNLQSICSSCHKAKTSKERLNKS